MNTIQSPSTGLLEESSLMRLGAACQIEASCMAGCNNAILVLFGAACELKLQGPSSKSVHWYSLELHV